MIFSLQPVPRAKNLDRIGFNAGYLFVIFRGQPAHYLFGPAIPRENFDKLLRSPYPDKLFSQIIRGKYQCKRFEP